MKHFLLYLFCLCNMVTWQPTSVFADEKPKKDKIEIEGEWENDIPKSLLIPIDAYIYKRNLTIAFYDAITDVTLVITGPAGIVETRTVSFAASQTETFNLDLCNEGFYTLTISTPRGTYLYGYFTL